MRPGLREDVRQFPVGGKVEIIERFGNVQIGIGVKTLDEIAAAVFEIILDLKSCEKSYPKRSLAMSLRPNFSSIDLSLM